MFLPILLFAIGIVLPFGLMLSLRQDDLPIEIVASAALLAVAAGGLLLWRARSAGRETAPRRPDRAAAQRLDWPKDLDPAQFEAYCAEYLRAHGWEVAPARSAQADGVYLEATGAAGRVLMLCEPRAARLTPMAIRGVAAVAEEFEQAGPVALTRGRVPALAAQAAERHGVTVLAPAQLAQLAAAARPAPVPAPAADAAHPAEPPATPPPP